MKTIKLRENGLHFPKGGTAVTRTVAFNLITEAIKLDVDGNANIFYPSDIDMKLPQTITVGIGFGISIPHALKRMVTVLKTIHRRNGLDFKFSVNQTASTPMRAIWSVR